MTVPQMQSTHLLLSTLSISELIQINNDEWDQMAISFDSEIISNSFQSAITKKIQKMNGINEKLHPWYTYWSIVDKATKKGIGLVGFKGEPDGNGYSEIGYGMSPNFRKRGLMTEAVKAIMEWARLNPNCS
ncbi:GNAT family N-acetyltransferase [Sporolactobacillus sp. CPB3-1]|uniref:GNAT family N-acetyltransferase n=1 Tax=Sporolactobacillus mangiferae TaxID=2940498 RepID=A0ABT0M9G3_9BACL|nr:GNAT family N-acetyltransferase [Sporolactobacillus mangiferae]MCL1631511.1 GNAT family N-acetyltransferase [Sporolactobacillus mangiferae]